MGFREEIHPGVDLYPCSRTRVLPPTIERRIKRATNLQVRDPAASHQLWSELDHDLVDRTPRVALGNNMDEPGVRAARQVPVHPQYGQLFDQMWVR